MRYLLLLLCICAPVTAADIPLPRVLLIGDSISIGYTKPVTKILRGKMNVHRVRGNAGHTGMGLERLDEWLAPEKGNWDVIHFNWGLWDLCYRRDGRKDKKQGALTHTIERYTANLEKIVTRLERTGADLVFATTTPVPPGEPGRIVGDDLRYNAAAVRVMRARGVAIDDLHGVMANRMDEFGTRPGDVHFKPAGSRVLAEQVVRSVERANRQRASAQRSEGGPEPEWAPARTLTYKKIGDVELTLDVFEPDGHKQADRRPAIVFFFGGGWNGGTKTQFHPHCEYLASRGMVAIAADYRVRSRHKTSPFECVADGKSALRWVRSHAKELGVDPKRIAAGGGSAGGHVAAAVGMCPGLDDPADDETVSTVPGALVLFNPVYDNGPGGYGHDRVKERWQEISPYHNIAKGVPPAIVFFGSNDGLVTVERAKEFQARMRKAGSRSELTIYPERKHGFFNHGRGDGADYKDTVRRMDAFLASLGYLEGVPTMRSRAGRF